MYVLMLNTGNRLCKVECAAFDTLVVLDGSLFWHLHRAFEEAERLVRRALVALLNNAWRLCGGWGECGLGVAVGLE